MNKQIQGLQNISATVGTFSNLNVSNTLTADTIVATDLVIPSITTPIINCTDVFASNSVNSLLLNSTIINAEDELKIPVIPTISGFPIQVKGSIVQDSGSSILYISNGSAWINGGTAGITSINGDVNSAQFITIGSSGNLLSSITTGGNTKINIPKATASASGIITTGNQEFSGNKIFKNDLTVSGTFTANGITGVITSINGNSNGNQFIVIGESGNLPNIDSLSTLGTTKINIQELPRVLLE